MSERPIPGTRFVRNMERAAPRFPIWPCTRWGFPCLRAYACSGGLLLHLFTLTPLLLESQPRSLLRHRHIANGESHHEGLVPERAGRFVFCGTIRQGASRHHFPRVSAADSCGYAASRPLVFGLSSSPGFPQGKRFSALPKSARAYYTKQGISRRLGALLWKRGRPHLLIRNSEVHVVAVVENPATVGAGDQLLLGLACHQDLSRQPHVTAPANTMLHADHNALTLVSD